MHNITELTVGRNFLPVLAVRTHKEFITESHCRFRFRFQWSIGKTGQCHRLAQVYRQRRSSDLFPTGTGQVVPIFTLNGCLQRRRIISSHLINVSSQTTFINLHPQPAGFYRRKTQHTLISDCRAFTNFFPTVIRQSLNGKSLYPLPFRYIFLKHYNIDFRLRLQGINSFTTRSGIPVVSSFFHPVVSKYLLAVSCKFFQTIHIRLTYQAFTIGRNIQQEHGIIAYRPEIDIRQMFQRLYFAIFRLMIEPPRTDRHIHFRRIPEQLRGLLQHLTAS